MSNKKKNLSIINHQNKKMEQRRTKKPGYHRCEHYMEQQRRQCKLYVPDGTRFCPGHLRMEREASMAKETAHRAERQRKFEAEAREKSSKRAQLWKREVLEATRPNQAQSKMYNQVLRSVLGRGQAKDLTQMMKTNHPKDFYGGSRRRSQRNRSRSRSPKARRSRSRSRRNR